MRRARLSGAQRVVAVLLSLLTFLSAGFRPSLSTADIGGLRLSHRQAQELTETLAGPPLGARAALLYDMESDRVLYEREAHARLAPASLTKLATALAALSRLDLQQVITVGDEATAEDWAGSSIGLAPGDQATVEQLLYGVLLTSANDAAAVLAAGAGGSTEQFVGWMNELAGSLGMRDTHFVNPHGLDAPDHYSSAYDMMLLTRAALRQPAIAKAVAMPTASIGGWNYVNRNELLGQYPGADGVKTGTTDEASQCLIASVTHEGRRVLAVILGSEDRYADARALLDFYFARYVWLPLGLPANSFTSLQPATSGQPRYLTPAGEAAALLARWELPWLEMDVQVEPDQQAGRARYRIADFVIAETPLAVRSP